MSKALIPLLFVATMHALNAADAPAPRPSPAPNPTPTPGPGQTPNQPTTPPVSGTPTPMPTPAPGTQPNNPTNPTNPTTPNNPTNPQPNRPLTGQQPTNPTPQQPATSFREGRVTTNLSSISVINTVDPISGVSLGLTPVWVYGILDPFAATSGTSTTVSHPIYISFSSEENLRAFERADEATRRRYIEAARNNRKMDPLQSDTPKFR